MEKMIIESKSLKFTNLTKIQRKKYPSSRGTLDSLRDQEFDNLRFQELLYLTSINVPLHSK